MALVSSLELLIPCTADTAVEEAEEGSTTVGPLDWSWATFASRLFIRLCRQVMTLNKSLALCGLTGMAQEVDGVGAGTGTGTAVLVVLVVPAVLVVLLDPDAAPVVVPVV